MRRRPAPREVCRKGLHRYALVGKTANGACAACRRIWHAAYMATWNPERRRLATENYNAKMPELRTRLPRAEVDAILDEVGERGVAPLLRTLLREHMKRRRQNAKEERVSLVLKRLLP